jgi:hypothetical protein
MTAAPANPSVAESLPHVDEHSIEVEAAPEAVWPAMLSVAGGAFRGRGKGLFAAAVGASERAASGTVGEVGSTIVGFRVARSEPPSLLSLEGSHRFSRYALIFRVDDLGRGRSRLRAETRAVFPGPHGKVYRGLVIGSRIHVLVTRRMLAAIKQRAG